MERTTVDYERAAEIVRACVAHVYHEHGIREEPPPSLADYSLAELLEAQRVVREPERGTGTYHVVCDDRLVAALYVAYHYPADAPSECEPICRVGRKAVVVVDIGGAT